VSHTPDELRDVILEAINRIAPEADVRAVPGDAYLGDEIDIDSMDMLNIVTEIFDRTGIDIPERDYGKLSTLDEFTAYLVGAASAG